MNRKTKGLVAAAAGLAMLVGTGATFATWVDSSAIGSPAAVTGDLWIDAEDMVWDTEINFWAPGDVATATAEFEGLLLGDNLTAQLTLDGVPVADDDADLLPFVITGARLAINSPSGTSGSINISYNPVDGYLPWGAFDTHAFTLLGVDDIEDLFEGSDDEDISLDGSITVTVSVPRAATDVTPGSPGDSRNQERDILPSDFGLRLTQVQPGLPG